MRVLRARIPRRIINISATVVAPLLYHSKHHNTLRGPLYTVLRVYRVSFPEKHETRLTTV